MGEVFFPLGQNIPGHCRARVAFVIGDQFKHFISVSLGLDRFKLNHLWIAAHLEAPLGIPNVGDAAGHARSKVAPGFTQNHNPTPRHVFATMITHTLDNGTSARVSDSKALGCNATQIHLARGCAVQHNITCDDVFLRLELGHLGRIDHNASAGQTFANKVIGIAFDFKRDTLGQEAAKALPGRAMKFVVNRVVGQHLGPDTPHDQIGEHGANHPMRVLDWHLHKYFLAALDRRRCVFHQLVIQGFAQTMVLIVNGVRAKEVFRLLCRSE